MEVTTIGLDLAKRVFQVHAVNAEGAIVLRKARGADRCCPSSPSCPRVSSGLRPASPRIIGPAS
jgi:transposase